MPLVISEAEWRAIFPQAPPAIIDAFTDGAPALDAAGITASRTRLAYALANVEHECGGYALAGLTENINYTPRRMAEVWPNRFSSADDFRRKYGSGPDWRKRAFDDIYGGRNGNRPATSDGSTYIGRGGPQITGRDGYKQVGSRCGLDLVGNPELATRPEAQPAILAAFWSWKGLNASADARDFVRCVKKWNGGTNGLADRKDTAGQYRSPYVCDRDFRPQWNLLQNGLTRTRGDASEPSVLTDILIVPLYVYRLPQPPPNISIINLTRLGISG